MHDHSQTQTMTSSQVRQHAHENLLLGPPSVNTAARFGKSSIQSTLPGHEINHAPAVGLW